MPTTRTQLPCKAETSQPLKDARLPTRTRLYEEHHNSHKASGAHIPLAYGSQFKIATFNLRFLLKITMHRQIVNHMRKHDIHILCMQETRSKNTTQYVVDNYTFLTVSTASGSQPEYAGVGFVLSPTARNALVRTIFTDSRIAYISLLIKGGELNILNTDVPQNARPEDERRRHFDQLQRVASQIAHKGPFLVMRESCMEKKMFWEHIFLEKVGRPSERTRITDSCLSIFVMPTICSWPTPGSNMQQPSKSHLKTLVPISCLPKTALGIPLSLRS